MKIVINKKLFIALLVIILIASYSLWGMDRVYSWAVSNNDTEQTQLRNQIAEAQTALAQISFPDDDLHRLGQQLAEAERYLAIEENTFPSDVNSNQLIETILMLADACGVKVSPVKTESWNTANVNEHIHGVFRMSVVVEGNLPQLQTFISSISGLADGDFETLVVEQIQLVVNESNDGETMPIEATLDLAIYTQGPKSD